MLLRKLLHCNGQPSPKTMVPVSMALIALGLMLIVVSIVLPKSSFPAPTLGPNWNDFFRGFLVGVAIVMEIGGVVIAAAATGIRKS